MTPRRRVVAGCLVPLGLAFAAGAALVALDRSAVFRHIGATLEQQSEHIDTTLFRLGETMSIQTALKSEYGAKPEVTYDRAAEGRTLRIEFATFELPAGTPTEERALEIAVFALAQTKKAKEVDAVEVRFRSADGEPISFRFAAAEAGRPTSLPH